MGVMRWGFRMWQVVASTLAAAGLGLVTNLVTQSATAPLIIAFAAFVVVQAGLGLWQGQREQAEARRARDAALGELRPEASPGSGELHRLTAPFCPTPLWARNRECQDLVNWCTDQDQGSVRILSGAGGVGKSRLALAVAEALPGPWVAGWLLPDGELIARVVACPEPVLVLVDDADRVAGLAGLIAAAAAHRDQVKLLLICRNGQGLRTVLRQQLPEGLRPLLAADPVGLTPVGADTDRIRWFDAAIRAYARQLRVPRRRCQRCRWGRTATPCCCCMREPCCRCCAAARNAR